MASLIGGVALALVVRLVVQLLAARPDNPVFAALLALTAPLVAPFAALDAGQPRFGAVLEFSTLALLLLLLVALAVVVGIAKRRNTCARHDV